MRLVVLVGVPVVLLVLAGVGGILWRSSTQALHPAPGPQPRTLDDYPELAPERVSVRASAGATLAGRLFPGRTKATVVLSHGYGGNQNEVLPVAAALHAAGFTVFTYDLRGCGESTGEVTFGAKETDDLVSVVRFLADRPEVDANRIGAYGFSMGGATTIMAAAAEPRIHAVVADSAWSDVWHWIRPGTHSAVRIDDRFSPPSLKLVELRAGIDLDAIRPVDVIGRIEPRPVLLLHGTADDVVVSQNATLNIAAAGPHAKLWTIPGGRHGTSLEDGGAAASQRVIDFLSRALYREEAA